VHHAPSNRLTVAALLLAAATVLVAVAADVARARPFESFTLELHDKIVAEAPGCYASCSAFGGRRNCTVKQSDCRAICTTLPECKPDGVRPMQVCAVVKERP
jgi:hypothetical protein